MDKILNCDIPIQQQLKQPDTEEVFYWVQTKCQINLWIPSTFTAFYFLIWVLYAITKSPQKEQGTGTPRAHCMHNRLTSIMMVILALETIILKVQGGLGLNFYSSYLVLTLINQIAVTVLIIRCPSVLSCNNTKSINSKNDWRIMDILVLLDFPVQSIMLTNWFPVYFTALRAYYQQAHFINRMTMGVSSVESNQLLKTESDETNSAHKDGKKDSNEVKLEEKSFNILYSIIRIVLPHTNYSTLYLIFGVFILRIGEGLIKPLGPVLAKMITDYLTALGRGESVGLPYFVWLLMFFQCIHKSLIGYSGFIDVLKSWATNPIDKHIQCELSRAVMFHIHQLGTDYHLTTGSGKIESIMQRGIWSITVLIKYIMFNAIPQLANLLFSLTIAYNLYDIRYYTLMGFKSALFVVMSYAITKREHCLYRSSHELYDEYKSILTDSLINFESVKLFTNENYEASRFKAALLNSKQGRRKDFDTIGLLNSLKGILTNFFTLLILGLCAYDVSLGKRSVSDLVLLTAFLEQITEPIMHLTNIHNNIIQRLASAEKLVALIKKEPSVKDPDDKKELILDEKNNTEIIFDKVKFGYKREEGATLKEMSFKVPNGKVAALVGPSGGGKSTIIKLLLRLYDPESGSISIGGQCIDQVTQNSLRKIIGVVPQDTPLFNDSIEYNIKYGNFKASQEEIIEAAKLAQIHDIILSFSEKYNTKVGERGLRLSGGEKQRVAIARAFVRKPAVILLDEATSALDTETEKNLQKSLNQLTENRTTLIIAHRLSTIIHADIIFCVQDGLIAEQGTHHELLKLDGVYAKMWHKSIESENVLE